MATWPAIAQGFVDAGVVTGGQMVACAAHYDKLEKTTAELGLAPVAAMRWRM